MKLLPLFIFWGLWYINFSARIAFSPLLPLIEDSLYLSHGQAGGLFLSLSIGHTLALLVTGRFASVWGYKKTVAIGFVGISFVLLALQWTESYLAFHALFLLLGIAGGTYLPSILPIITETYGHRHWGKAIGFHDSAASFSIFSIPILVAFGLNVFPWKRLLLILAVASLLLAIYFWRVSAEPKREKSQQGGHYVDLLRIRSIWVMGFLWIFSSASSSGIYSILPLYLVKERGADIFFANKLLGISRVCGIFVAILIGFLADRYEYKKILKWSVFTTGLSTIGLSLSSNLFQLLFTLVFQATLSLAFFPVGFMAISKLTSLSERAMTTGVILSFGMIFGTGVTPFILGVTADHFSFQVGIFWLGVLTTFSPLAVRFLREG
jgi:MFS family permease